MTSAETDPRTTRIFPHRQQASRAKQTQALTALYAMQARQETISFAAVDRAAKVSTWLLYNNPASRAAIEEAIALQLTQTTSDAAGQRDDRPAPGLKAELLDARDEIRLLRIERDKLRQRLQRTLGPRSATSPCRRPRSASLNSRLTTNVCTPSSSPPNTANNQVTESHTALETTSPDPEPRYAA